MKKKIFLISIAACFLILLVLSSIFFWWNTNTSAVSSDKTLKNFIVAKGDTAVSVGNKLKNQGLIKNVQAFKIYTRIIGISGNIPVGEYKLAANLNLFELVDRLSAGPNEIWVTIPEGLRREEIAERFIKSLGLITPKAEIFRIEFLAASKGQEGYLFPDTYLFSRDVTPTVVVNKMRSTFDKKISDIKLKDVILASLIERETKGNDEKPIVAGILLKREKVGWPLQVDAALQYAVASSKAQGSKPLSNWWEPLTKADLDINSTFNTYKNTGLPPEPIASPGLISLKAALNSQDSPYWFYIHDPSGQIHYAATLYEHNQNIKTYLKR